MKPDFLDDAGAERRDEIIREVRANREAYASRFDFDVRAILRRSRERAGEGGRKATAREPRRTAVPGSA